MFVVCGWTVSLDTVHRYMAYGTAQVIPPHYVSYITSDHAISYQFYYCRRELEISVEHYSRTGAACQCVVMVQIKQRVEAFRCLLVYASPPPATDPEAVFVHVIIQILKNIVIIKIL